MGDAVKTPSIWLRRFWVIHGKFMNSKVPKLVKHFVANRMVSEYALIAKGKQQEKKPERLFGRKENLRRPIGSLTKDMTGFLLFDYIKKGDLKLDDNVTISPDAAVIHDYIRTDRKHYQAGDQNDGQRFTHCNVVGIFQCRCKSTGRKGRRVRRKIC